MRVVCICSALTMFGCVGSKASQPASEDGGTNDDAGLRLDVGRGDAGRADAAGHGDGGGFQSNPILVGLPDNTAMHLGAYECKSRIPQMATGCYSIFDYSRFNYDPYNHRILLFGGGHSATGRTDVDVLDLNTFAWSSLYSSMSCEDVQANNTDPHGFHLATGHPVTRHTYDMNVVALGRLYMLSSSGLEGTCHQYVSDIRATAWLDLTPGNVTWEYGELYENRLWSSGSSAEFDPPSGKIILVGQGQSASPGGMRVIDAHSGAASDFVKAVSYDGQIDHNLVYYPPTQTMYLINREDRGKGHIIKLNLDRIDWTKSTSEFISTTGTTPVRKNSTGWAYDSRNQVFGGAVEDGAFFTFDPRTSSWERHVMDILAEGEDKPTAVYHHNLDYDPINNVFFFIAKGPKSAFHLWAYRLRQ